MEYLENIMMQNKRVKTKTKKIQEKLENSKWSGKSM